MEGSIFLTSEAADLVRMEGLLVKRPSFWTRKVEIVRDYGRIAGVRVPHYHGLDRRHPLCRAVDVHDDYEYESINDVPVRADDASVDR